MRSLEDLFLSDLGRLKELLLVEGNELTGYHIYASVEGEDESVTHMTSFNASDMTTLIGRTEITKQIMIQKHIQYKTLDQDMTIQDKTYDDSTQSILDQLGIKHPKEDEAKIKSIIDLLARDDDE